MGHPEAVHLLQRHIEALEREAEGEFVLPPDHDTEFDSFDEHRHEYDNLGYGAPMAVAAADETNKVQNIFNITNYIRHATATSHVFVRVAYLENFLIGLKVGALTLLR